LCSIGAQFPLRKKGRSPLCNFRPMSIVARQLDGSGWHMACRWEVGLSPGDFVRWGPSYPRKGHTHSHPTFGPCLLWPNGWMDEDATWYESRPRPRPHCIRRGPSYPRKGHSSPPLFGPYLLWPRLPISATAELLYIVTSFTYRVDRYKKLIYRDLLCQLKSY